MRGYQPNTKYKTVKRLTPTVYATRNLLHVQDLCDKAKREKCNNIVLGSFGLGRTVGLTHYSLQNLDTFYVRIKGDNQINFKSFLKQLVDSLTPSHGETSLEMIATIVKELGQRQVSLLIIDDFHLTIGWITAASILCESLSGKTGIVFSCELSEGEWSGLIRYPAFQDFITSHASWFERLLTPRQNEVREICQDRGVPHHIPFYRNCKNFYDLNLEIDLHLKLERDGIDQ